MAGAFSGWVVLLVWWALIAWVWWGSAKEPARWWHYTVWRNRLVATPQTAYWAFRGAKDVYRYDARLGLFGVLILGPLIVFTNTPLALGLCGALLFVVVGDQLRRTYLWAVTPTAFVRTAEKALREHRRDVVTLIAGAMPREPDAAQYAAAQALIGELHKGLDRFIERLDQGHTTTAIVQEFVSRFLVCFSVLVSGMGFIYLAAWKVHPLTFKSATSTPTPNWVDALFFSLTTVATSGISELIPHSSLAKALVSAEHLGGAVFLLLIGVAFSTTVAPDLARAEEDRKKLYRLLDAYIDDIQDPIIDAWVRKHGLPE